MPTVKTAVSLPAEIYHKAEKLRKKMSKSRSELIADALAAMIRADDILEKEARDRAAYQKTSETPEALAESRLRTQEALTGRDDDWSEEYNAAR
jgi:metal-responsive CopG/Arc/MetJ family transcriptional regulator